MLVLATTVGSAFAGSGDGCYVTFYKTKDFDCINVLINEIENVSVKLPVVHNFDHSNIQAHSGFLAEIFVNYPNKKRDILNQDVSAFTKSVFVESLYRAGLKGEAKKYADQNLLTDIYDTYKKHSVKKIANLKSGYIPYENDALVGAFFATGDDRYISNILYNFQYSSKDMVKDGIRVGLMISKFGNGLSPPERESGMLKNLCKKYSCSKDKKDMLRVMTLATAFWSLRYLSEQHEIIDRTFSNFFEQDGSLQSIVLEETINLSNYRMNLAISITNAEFADDENIQIYNTESVEEFLQSYERLEEVGHKVMVWQ